MNAAQDDLVHLHELGEHLRENQVPLCPQLRPATAQWLYPVEGYCTLEHIPGGLMIPSIEEYRTYCTSSRFHECKWFRKAVPTEVRQAA